MKTTVLQTAILTLLSSPTLYALGLGDMKVHSYLNQPFHGEIALIDVKGMSLDSIKARLASIEDYEQVGIEQGYAVNLLQFTIGTNAQGKPVIVIRSTERITDPYMQLLVDLAWPDGQLYREYNILLDPPGYQLGSSTVYGGRVTHHSSASSKKQAGVVDKTIISHVVHSTDNAGEIREQSTYGPVKADETIWQIAQRYKTEAVNLQQLVLAIVGMTPNAFENGNLNGLKVGSKLTIPSSETVQQIPPALAKQEVKAHDEAWKGKSEIQHVLLPPYIEGKQAELSQSETATSMIPVIALPSEIPAVPKTPVTPETPDASQKKTETRGLMSSVMSATTLFIPEGETANKKAAPASDLKADRQASDADLKTRAEISIATSAVESVKDANVILNEQLKLLREQNKQLQAHLERREKDLGDLRVKIDMLLTERQSPASQAYAAKDEKEKPWGTWPLWLLLLLLAGGGGFLLWYFYGRSPEDEGPVIIPPANLSDETSKDKAADEILEEKNTSAAIFPTGFEPGKEPPKTTDEMKTKAAEDKQTTVEIEDDIDTSALEEVSVVPVPTPQPESITVLASSKEKEKDISDSSTQEIKEGFPDQTHDEKEEAIEDEVQNMASEEETLAEQEELSSDKIDSSNHSFEQALEPSEAPSPSKEYGLNKDYKRPLSTLGELEIDELQPVQNNFEPATDIELPEIDITELENYSSDPEVKEMNTESDKDLDYPVDYEPEKQEVKPPKPEKNLENSGEEQLKEEPQDEFLLDFEPGLYQPESETEADHLVEKEPDEASKDSEHNLDFILEDDKADTESEQKKKSEEAPQSKKEQADTSQANLEQTEPLANPLKSKAALDTLLALAKTYIGMDDIEAARQSLQEVAENGDEEQKAEALQLLGELDKK